MCYAPLRDHATVAEETAKVAGATSALHIGEAHFTPAKGGPQGHRRDPMSYVFVLDAEKRPLNSVHPGRARILLRQGHAAVLRRHPFTIILRQACPAANPTP